MPKEPRYIVSVRPAPGHAGPTLVSDDPDLVRIVVEAIRATYDDPDRFPALRLEPDPAA